MPYGWLGVLSRNSLDLSPLLVPDPLELHLGPAKIFCLLVVKVLQFAHLQDRWLDFTCVKQF